MKEPDVSKKWEIMQILQNCHRIRNIKLDGVTRGVRLNKNKTFMHE